MSRAELSTRTGFGRIFKIVPDLFVRLNQSKSNTFMKQIERPKRTQLDEFVTEMVIKFNIQPPDEELLRKYIILRVEYYLDKFFQSWVKIPGIPKTQILETPTFNFSYILMF